MNSLINLATVTLPCLVIYDCYFMRVRIKKCVTKLLIYDDQIGRVPLRQQISNFEQSRRHMVKVMGERNTSKFLKEAIFSVTIGANDVLNYIQPLIHIPFLHDHGTISPSIFQDFLISNLTTHLKVRKLNVVIKYATNNYLPKVPRKINTDFMSNIYLTPMATLIN